MDATAAKAPMTGSASNTIEIVVGSVQIIDVEPEPVIVQSPPLPTLPTVVSALKINIEETAATGESAPLDVEMQDESSTFLEEVVVDDVEIDGCEDLSESSVLPQPMEVSALQDEEIIFALERDVEEMVESTPGAVETRDEGSALLEEVDVDDINNDAWTPKESVVNEGLIPSVVDNVEVGESSTTIHDAFLQPTKELNEETTEETIQNIRQETAEGITIMGTTEGGPENNHQEPTSTNASSFLSHPIKSDESSEEDIDTTFEVTDNEEELEDPTEETPEKSDEDAVTCKAENDNYAMSSVEKSSCDQKSGYASHTSNKSPASGGSVSSLVELYARVGADEKVQMDPNLIEEGRTGETLNETKALFPTETCWSRQKSKYAFGCFLLVVLLAVVLGVVVAGSRGRASPAKSPTVIAPSPSPSAASSTFDLEKFQSLLPAYSQAALLDDASSQAKAFAWLERDSDLALYSDFQRLQRYALATLFYATNGEQWSNKDGWVEDFPFDECDWFMGEPRSIEECVNGRHEDLILDLNGLVGTLPIELAMMTDLKVLRLSFNGLKGAIPSQYGLLTNLQTLSLYLNLLDGQIPLELGRLTVLEDIELTRNSLTGPIPSEVLTGWNKVKMLRISGNDFSGVIPTEVGNLKSAEYIDLSDNAFEGQIPTELALLTNLETLYLHNNADISGPIPSVLGSLSQLQIITFDNTNLSGAMPRELCDLMQRHFVVIEVDCSRVTCDCGCTCV